jgi:transcriptional regulator GlxA family with amidase domain
MAARSPTLETVERVAIVIYDGFDELDAIGPYEVLRNAVSQGIDLSVRLCTLDETDEVRASHGLRVVPDSVLDDFDVDGTGPDLLVVPGGGWNDRSAAGARAEAETGELPDAIRAHYDAGRPIASVCTGGMVVASAGLLDGRRAITHHGAIDELGDTGAEVVDARVVDDGDLLSAGGVTAGIDLALYLVECIASEAVADTVAREMEYERTGEVHRTDRDGR